MTVTATAVITERVHTGRVILAVTLRDAVASLTGPVEIRGGCAIFTNADPIRAYLAICTPDQQYTVRAIIRTACLAALGRGPTR